MFVHREGIGVAGTFMVQQTPVCQPLEEWRSGLIKPQGLTAYGEGSEQRIFLQQRLMQ